MNIILLSGGSGQRLWPLSNNIRSKQFIKLFRNGDGNCESMLQRVCRQIYEVDSEANIVIATGKSQVSEIYNQLGGGVAVCVEPERRNTFPAITLAVSYLADIVGINKDEPVIVCPVDPYVDNDYFMSILRLEQIVRHNGEGIVLMGAEPVHPSEKYGYIIPADNAELSLVIEFKEKPDIKTAEEYIERGALWNCGVLGFRLDYLLEKVRAMIGFDGYDSLVRQYAKLPNVSFDYAILEHEKGIRVLRFGGAWKDIGTWNTFVEAMSESIIGQAVLDDTCRDIHVVNELNIPILCMGLKDTVVVAGNDGILVADKEQSSRIKPYVEQLDSRARYAEKSWGTFVILDVQERAMTVKISIKAGKRLNYHSHNYRNEVWTVLSGDGESVVDGVHRMISAGDVVLLPKGCKHTVRAITELNIIEVQEGEEITVHDKVGYEQVL
ncbi:MAG: sugar phosphate nucleotidyltransferase [Butyrivibrio sp.]|nr:sugar phosphate nucleotidyltransferase [Butyrivibrio sp.]